ncbi:MAG TPA: hypothetical protein VKT81_07655 [Bryobacteraceae bacterium]|nr:hypothetical protein [Bryobacteraceae bacterium]
MITATAYDKHVEQLFEVMKRVHIALTSAGIDYRIVGGMGVFLQVSQRDPIAARLTRDVDIAVKRDDLQRIAAAVEPHGFKYRHAAGVDMLVDATQPKARSAVHFVFIREKVRPDYLEPVPDFSTPTRTTEGLLLAPIPDLLRMKLTSLRLKDKVHIIDMDGVGLITPEIEAALPEVLRQRLQQVRAEDHQ